MEWARARLDQGDTPVNDVEVVDDVDDVDDVEVVQISGRAG